MSFNYHDYRLFDHCLLVFCRRQVFWISKQILHLIMDDAIDDWLLRQIHWLRRDDIIALGIRWVQDVRTEPFSHISALYWCKSTSWYKSACDYTVLSWMFTWFFLRNIVTNKCACFHTRTSSTWTWDNSLCEFISLRFYGLMEYSSLEQEMQRATAMNLNLV